MKNVVKKTLPDQIHEILREEIIRQQIPCGEKLTLKMLQERFGLSSTPIREALNRLSQDGLVEQITNVGARVVTLGRKDIEEIYDLCASLDRTAVEMADRSERRGALVEELKACVRRQQESLEAGDGSAYLTDSDEFHDLFYQHADNRRLVDAARRLRSQLSILTSKYQHMDSIRPIVTTQHEAICAAFATGDIGQACARMNAHFEQAKRRLLDELTASGA